MDAERFLVAIMKCTNMIQSHTVDLETIQLHYVEAPGPDPALVFIHGITGSHTASLPFLPIMMGEAHSYAIDLRGHGQSSRTPGAYRVSDFGNDVIGFLRNVVGRPAFVAGHSLGGLVAIWVAAHAPDLVRGVLLEDPPLYITAMPRFKETDFYDYFVSEHAFLTEHQAAAGTLDAMIDHVGQMPINENQTMLEAAGIEAVRARSVQLQQLDPAIFDPAIEGVIMGRYDIDDLLTQIACPTILLAGEIDLGGALSEQDVEQAASKLRDGTVRRFPGVGHSIQDERPDQYVQTLKQFMASV